MNSTSCFLDLTKKCLFLLLILSSSFQFFGQEPVNPVIENYGGIYEVLEATIKPNSDQEYKIVVDVFGGTEDKTQIDKSLNNVARMLNLHSVGGVPEANMKVVLALHGQSTYSTLTDTAYMAQFGLDNPNQQLIEELTDAGVLITVCGQSLRARGFSKKELNPRIELAISMLTTVTHYQHIGYHLLKF
ncbi:MAG: DsrE family protein [Ekhidna sp.]|nr:DsrE family protein [Ekhidna sp.]